MTDVDSLTSKIALGRENQMRAVRAGLEALITRGQRGIVLADEVGCGKTYEALAIAALLWRHHAGTDHPVRRILIVADGALMNKWFNEVEVSASSEASARRGFPQYVAGDEWTGFRRMMARVSKLERRDDGDERGVHEPGKRQVQPDRLYITKQRLLNEDSGAASRQIRYLRNTDWDIVIVDEAHNYTNLKTRRSEVFFPDRTVASRAQGLQARYVLALTATPFQLSTSELLHLLRITYASEADLEALADALPRYERALETFYARRSLPPSDDARRRAVDALHRLRSVDACDGHRPNTPGLETLLRRYILRNVKPPGMRDYLLTERHPDRYASSKFDKLGDLRQKVSTSTLLPLEGLDAWVYMNVRDVIDDARASALTSGDGRPTFVAGDLRQCLSSWEQLAASSLLGRADLPRAAVVRDLVQRLQNEGHPHPKIAAICALVDEMLAFEIDQVRKNRGRPLRKVLVFNTLMKTARALREALQKTVEKRLDPFIDECVQAAGWRDVAHAAEDVRAALRVDLDAIRAELDAKFDARHMTVDAGLLRDTGLELEGDSRNIVDVMFRRTRDHVTQRLFLLRLALYFAHRRELEGDAFALDVDHIRDFLGKHVTDKLHHSLYRIVDDYLDDTPADAKPFSDENRDRARREIARLVRILGSPEYVGRFDGDASEAEKELRKDNFNGRYAPLVLLVSRVGEEGIDLQAHTRYVLHYDLEWNPARMEQREGRVDREGRRDQEPVQVQFFLLKDTYEERVFHTVMQRNAWFEILIGSKRKELGKQLEDEAEGEARDVELGDDVGQLTAEERGKVMLDLRP